MKPINKTFSILIGLIGLLSNALASDIPTGTIEASEDFVLAGTYPRLDWKIDYPVVVTEVITITPEGTIVPKSGVTMQVRNLAADVQRRTTNYSKRSGYYYTYEFIDVKAQARINNGGWSTVFDGTQPEVNSNQVVMEEDLDEGDEVTFRSKVNLSGYSYYYSGYESPNVILLKAGDTPPSYVTWDTQSTLGTHIAPYLDASGKVDIGPRDVIVAFELTHSMTGSSSDEGDGQDMIMLLTFQSTSSN